MLILKYLFYIFVFPGFLFCFFAGLILAGIDRKIVARMQKRIGPPILQPFYDFFKLMGKETIIPNSAAKRTFIAAPVAGLISLVTISLFIPIFKFSAFNAVADVIVIIYLLTIPAVSLIIGGSSSGSPYAGVGISREMVSIVSYELPLIIALLAVGKKAGMAVNDGMVTFSLSKIVEYQSLKGPMLFHWSMIPAFLAMLFVIPCEVGSLPFDIAEAEVEICEGPLVEYSGFPLGIYKLNYALKIFIFSSLFVTLFLSGNGTGIILFDAAIQYVLCIIVVILSVSLIRAVTARLRVEQMLKFYWTYPTALSILSLILVWLGL
ncbi:Formate hydrogenlyase subunit 4 [Caloramator quimbayensis]|uniref:Formate hydrogenlyase subunit 4 n=1 Tax=Caloramator quimbayensis TaxID=1147123 RepID=A0A1T4X1E5_9CLOT|nr:complex I subunit 1 family protein [Caloramator quimbayensis]SKA83329.1 Formate hydrogenlyase subunit 4 [Caloramator quimbayensis]